MGAPHAGLGLIAEDKPTEFSCAIRLGKYKAVASSPGHSHVFNVKTWEWPGDKATKRYRYGDSTLYYFDIAM